ncbi:MAG: hypothetical protein J6575_03595 [Bifidobacterium sp.]|nr:hypothetical protein [Bifidobacterium sp.]
MNKPTAIDINRLGNNLIGSLVSVTTHNGGPDTDPMTITGTLLAIQADLDKTTIVLQDKTRPEFQAKLTLDRNDNLFLTSEPQHVTDNNPDYEEIHTVFGNKIARIKLHDHHL